MMRLTFKTSMAGLDHLQRSSALRSIRPMPEPCWWAWGERDCCDWLLLRLSLHRGRSFRLAKEVPWRSTRRILCSGMFRLLPASASASAPSGAACTAANFAGTPTIGSAQVADDDSLIDAPWLLDPALSSDIVIGTCRVWRGPPGDGASWSSSNAISKLLGGPQNASCSSTNPVIRSLAAGGPASNAAAAQNAGSEVLYAGMAGSLDGGGSLGGHLFSLTDGQHCGQYDSVERPRNIAGDEWPGCGLQPRRVRSFFSCGGSSRCYRQDDLCHGDGLCR